MAALAAQDDLAEAGVARHALVGTRGLGLLRALVFEREVTPAIVKAARDLQPTGLLVNAPRPNLLRFMPALNVTCEEIDRMIELLQIAIAQADA